MPDLNATWHAAYCRWFDHRAAGHPRRARAWGFLADRLVGLFDRLHLWGNEER